MDYFPFSLQGELLDLAPERLKERGRMFREAFLTRLALLLRGTVSAPPEKFGETLADEHIRGGARFRTHLLYGRVFIFVEKLHRFEQA